VSAPLSLQSSLQRAQPGRIRRDATDASPHWHWLHGWAEQPDDTYTIFEGTSEIQRLVIARSISGRHIRCSALVGGRLEIARADGVPRVNGRWSFASG
jgi:hypothetical protein